MHYPFSRPAHLPLTLLAVGLALLAIFWFWSIFQRTDPCAAIPSETAIVLDFNPIDTAGTANIPHVPDYALRVFVEKSDLAGVRQQAAQAQRWVQHDTSLNQAFWAGRMLAALTLRNEDRGHALFVLDLRGSDAQLEGVAAALRDRTKLPPMPPLFLQNVEVSEQQFRGSRVWRFAEPGRGKFVFAQKDGCLIFSPSLALVEDALAQLETGGNWWSGCAFLREPDPAQPFRAVFRSEVLAQRLSERVLPKYQNLPRSLLRHLDWLGLSWDGRSLRAELGPKSLPSQLSACGMASLDKILGVLPANTTLVARAQLPTSWLALKKMDRPPSPDLEEFIAPWWGRELAYVATEPLPNDLTEHEFWVFEARDTARASTLLSAYGHQRGLLKNYDYQTFVLWQFAEGSLLHPLSGAGGAFQNPACAVVGGYVVFAASTAALERWIDQYVVGETLAANTDFLQMAQSLPAESGTVLLFNAANLPAFARSLCRPDWMLGNIGQVDALAPLGWVGADIQPTGRDGSLSLHIARGPAATTLTHPRTGLVWRTSLAAEAAIAPQIVGSSVLVQDVRHQLYCLGQDGRLRWRRQLSGPILSDIQGPDFFKNDTRCYFFNTPDALWLLDAEGRDVEGFPLKLRSPAVNGAVAASFGNNNEYGFFVALENGNVQGFNRLGQPLEGWNPQPAGGQVAVPLLHFQHDGKDYLAVLTRSGRLSVFGKNGQPRFAPVQLEGRFEGAVQANFGASPPCVVCFNHRGQAFACDVEGRATALPLHSGEGGEVQSGLLATGDGSGFEYALLTATTLAYGRYEAGQYRQIFSQKNDRPADGVFIPQSGCVGVLRRQQRSVALHSARGARWFEGSTPFRLLATPDGGSLLVVGNGASVCGYAGLMRNEE